MIRDVAIIGSGPAGYTAAIYGARANLNPLMLAGNEWGGQLTKTSFIENYPGHRDPISGMHLMTEMEEQAGKMGAELVFEDCLTIDLSRRPFLLKTSKETYESRTVIIATGAVPRKLGLESELLLEGHGVSYCAICEGTLFRGQDVIVVGGGDTALEEALHMSHLARKVTLVHRRDKLRASKIMQERAFHNEQIRWIWDTVVEEIGDPAQGTVTGVRLRNLKTGERTQMAIDGVFMGIGHVPATGFLNGQVELDEQGYIVLQQGQQTSIPGCFAAGDVHDHVYRQAITAAAAGCAAAMEAERFLEANPV